MKTHGHSSRVDGPSNEYRCWNAMVMRCTNPRRTTWARYGGAGVRVCERWRRSFAAFLADVGPRPSLQHSLDRFPNGAGNYEPGNVRWATVGEQQRNRKSTRFVDYAGERLCIRDWAARLGIHEGTISKRLAAGKSPEEALSTADFRSR